MPIDNRAISGGYPGPQVVRLPGKVGRRPRIQIVPPKQVRGPVAPRLRDLFLEVVPIPVSGYPFFQTHVPGSCGCPATRTTVSQ